MSHVTLRRKDAIQILIDVMSGGTNHSKEPDEKQTESSYHRRCRNILTVMNRDVADYGKQIERLNVRQPLMRRW